MNPIWELELKRALEQIDAIYYVYGKEVGEQGTPHIQGYSRSSKKIYKNTLTAINIPWYVDRAKRSEDDNYDYCTKENDFYEFGDRISNKSKAMAHLEEKRQERQKKSEEMRRLKMQEFLEAIRTKSQEELECLYPKEVFYHQPKIDSYRIMKQNLCETWKGSLKEKNFWF